MGRNCCPLKNTSKPGRKHSPCLNCRYICRFLNEGWISSLISKPKIVWDFKNVWKQCHDSNDNQIDNSKIGNKSCSFVFKTSDLDQISTYIIIFANKWMESKLFCSKIHMCKGSLGHWPGVAWKLRVRIPYIHTCSNEVVQHMKTRTTTRHFRRV